MFFQLHIPVLQNHQPPSTLLNIVWTVFLKSISFVCFLGLEFCCAAIQLHLTQVQKFLQSAHLLAEDSEGFNPHDN